MKASMILKKAVIVQNMYQSQNGGKEATYSTEATNILHHQLKQGNEKLLVYPRIMFKPCFRYLPKFPKEGV